MLWQTRTKGQHLVHHLHQKLQFSFTHLSFHSGWFTSSGMLLIWCFLKFWWNTLPSSSTLEDEGNLDRTVSFSSGNASAFTVSNSTQLLVLEALLQCIDSDSVTFISRKVTVASEGAVTWYNFIRDITNTLQTCYYFPSSSLFLTLTWLIEPGNCLSHIHLSSAMLAGCWCTSSILFPSVIWQGRNLLPSNSWMLQFLQPHQSEPCASEPTFPYGSSLGENQRLNRCALVQCQNTPVN